MKNYFDKLQNKVNKLKNKYATHPRRAALKFALWNLKCVFHKTLKPYDNSYKQTKEFWRPTLSPDKLTIGFCLEGGVGDLLISALYIQELRKKITCPLQIDVYGHPSQKINESLFNKDTFDNVYPRQLAFGNEHLYDLFIKQLIYPVIWRFKPDRIAAFSPWLSDYCAHLEHFKTQNEFILNNQPNSNALATTLELKKGRMRVQQPDIGGKLGIMPDSTYHLNTQNDDIVLKKYGLKKGKYITLHRGIDGTSPHKEHTKLYPVPAYNQLAALIKKNFPRLPLVQLGISADRCVSFEHIDKNLIGQTDFAELQVILKHAALHIDGEGGMVHMRHFLSGRKSVVVFGPTSARFFGYPENINISAEACSGCEWLTPDWAIRCPKGNATPDCMASIAPSLIFDKIKSDLQRIQA